MDKQDNKSNVVKTPDLPAVNKEEKNTSETNLPKEKNSDDKAALDMTLPSLNIENSEAKEDKPPVQGTSVLDNKADFQSIFHVESEEVPEEKKATKNAKDDIAAPKIVVEKEEEAALPEDKANQSADEVAAKKAKRKESFNGEERTIFQIQEEKEGNPIVVLLFFLALIGCIFALPLVSKKLNIRNGVSVNNGGGTNAVEKEDDKYFYFDRTSVRASIGNLEFTNFVKHKRNDKYTLTFNISNKQKKAYTFDEKYYVVFYEGDQIVYRALIYSKDAIGANAITSVEININERSYKESDRFKVEEILPSSYPTAVLNDAEGEYRILTCKYLNDEMKYYFLDNKLTKVKETYRESLEDSSTFTQDLEKYSSLSERYKTVPNFNSTFISSATEFMMVNEFYYKDIPDTTLNNLNEFKFFRYNESKDIVNFEMEATSYNCG